MPGLSGTVFKQLEFEGDTHNGITSFIVNDRSEITSSDYAHVMIFKKEVLQ